ncbi:MAG: STAS domain-containing protein [Actinomycetota bacterium]|nr:STAS domain-containing protein [Actinomycetota bacterium]
MEIEVDELEADGGKIARVRLIGEVDLANADELSEVLGSKACTDSAGILLDLRELEFMDSSGLRAVLIAAQEREERFATVLSEGSAVGTLFEMVDVSDRLCVASDEAEAIAHIRAGADAPT